MRAKSFLFLTFITAIIFGSQGQETVEEFGKKMFESLKSNDQESFLELIYKSKDLFETIEAQTENPEIKEAITKEIKEGFDQKVKGESIKSFQRLTTNEYHGPIEWKKIKFKGFDYEENEKRTTSSGIQMGKGKLLFEYKGRVYNIGVDKMAKLVTGWRANEFDTSAQLERDNQ